MTGERQTDCVNEKARASIVGIAGHVDHGKTALARALTGISTHRLPEEKKRGITIDIGFAHMDAEIEGRMLRIAIVDVPGHERFIENMLAGATGVKAVLFAIAADDGIMPQTREHLDIIRLLGVKKCVFAITKADLADMERIREVSDEVALLAKNTPLAGSPILPVSAITGQGIEGLKAVLVKSVVERRGADESGFFRLPVDRSFHVKGFGTVVTGAVASGNASTGDELLCFHSGAAVKVRGIQSLYAERERVHEGERAALNISNISHQDINRGECVVDKGLGLISGGLTSGKHFSADCFFELLDIRDASNRRIEITGRSLLKVFHLTGESEARIRLTPETPDPKTGRRFGRLFMRKRLPMLCKDRFILRDPSRNMTIGGGVVCLPHISRRMMPRPFKDIAPPVSEDDVEGIVRNLLPRGLVGCRKNLLSAMLNIKDGNLFKGVSGPGFREMGGFVVSIERLGAMEEDVLKTLSGFHRTNPIEAGMREDRVFSSVAGYFKGIEKNDCLELFRHIIDNMPEKGVKRIGAYFSLSTHAAELKGSAVEIQKAMEGLFGGAVKGISAGEVFDLPFKKDEIEKVLKHLQMQGAVVKLKEGSFVSGPCLKSVADMLKARTLSNGGIKASELRDMLGCGRKLAIEILEYFDGQRITLRRGDVRTLR